MRITISKNNKMVRITIKNNKMRIQLVKIIKWYEDNN